jgi:hypothetical protein
LKARLALAHVAARRFDDIHARAWNKKASIAYSVCRDLSSSNSVEWNARSIEMTFIPLIEIK